MHVSVIGSRYDQSTRNQKGWRFQSSFVALAACLASTPAIAQNAPPPEPTTEIIVDSADTVGDFTFNPFGGVSPVLIGSDGDVLFRANNFVSDRFIAASNGANLVGTILPSSVASIRANVGSSVPLANYSIADIDNGYAVFGRAGNDGQQLYIGTFDDTSDSARQSALLDLINGGAFFDQGNLFSGAIPLINDDNIAVLVSNIANETTQFPGVFNTTNAVFLSTDFGQSYREISSLDGSTSLRFAGDSRIFGSLNTAVASANSALVDQILYFDTDLTDTSSFSQLGPSSGDLTYGGFSFFTRNPGVANFGEGAQLVDGAFSIVGDIGVFAVGNVETALDGSPGDDARVTQAIFLENLAAGNTTETALLVIGVDTATSLGNIRFESIDDLVVSAAGDVFFAGRARDTNNRQVLPVSYWRIENPGAANQTIIPVLAPGSVLNTVDGQQFTVAGQPTGFSERTLAIDTTLRDGRTQLISVNSEGRVALYGFLELSPGTVIDALIAQSDDGTFHVVTYVGQKVEVDGVERTVEDFTFQFGSNDVDGFGDGYNADEQLAYQLFFTDDSFAIARTSLNGEEANPDITNYLWRGDCGDDEFSTICRTGGEDGSNWVDADNVDQIADGPPGSDPSPQNAVINGVDVRIAVADVSINRLESDAKLTLQDGRTLTLAGGGDIKELVVENGNFVANGVVDIDTLQLDAGTITANDFIKVTDSLDINGGRLAGTESIDVGDSSAIQTALPQGNISGNVTLATDLSFFADSEVVIETATLDIEAGGELSLNQGADLTIKGATITGNGLIVVEGESASITSEGLNFLSASVLFENADDARLVDSAPDLLRVASGTLNARELIFQADNPTDIVTNTTAGIAIDPGAALEIASGGRLVAESFVEVKQTLGTATGTDPVLTFSNGSTLSIGTLGTFNVNMGDTGQFTLNNAQVEGGGLLVNQSTLRSFNSDFKVVFANIGTASFFGNNRIETSSGAAEIRRADDLFRRGVGIATGIDIGEGEGPAFGISALLANASFVDGNNLIEGDGVAFLINSNVNGGQLTSTGSTLVAGDITIAPEATFTVTGDLIDNTGFAVLATTPVLNLDQASATFKGSGFAILDFTDIQGLISANNAQFKFANLTNALGEDFLAANPGFLTSVTPVDPSAGGFLSIETSSITDLTILNTGSTRLDDVTFGSNAALFNRGLLNIAGPLFEDPSANANTFIENTAGARLQLTGGLVIDVAINNFGLLTVNGSDRDITLAELNVLSESNELGRQSIRDRAKLTALSGNALSAEASAAAVGAGPGVGLTGLWSIDNAEVTLQNGTGTTPTISWIAPNAYVELFGSGQINNLGKTIADLRRVDGTLLATDNVLSSDKLIVGKDGQVTLKEVRVTGDLNVEGKLTIEGYQFLTANVTGTLMIESDATKEFTQQRTGALTVGTGGVVSFDRAGRVIVDGDGNDSNAFDEFGAITLESTGQLQADGVDLDVNTLAVRDMATLNARDLFGETFTISGQTPVTIRSAQFNAISIGAQSRLEFGGGIFADTVTVEGMLLSNEFSTDPNQQNDIRNSGIGTLAIKGTGAARIHFGPFDRLSDQLGIGLLTVDKGGMLLVDDAGGGFGDYQFDTLNINGNVAFNYRGRGRQLLANELTIGATGTLNAGAVRLQTNIATIDNILTGTGPLIVSTTLKVGTQGMVSVDQLLGATFSNGNASLTNNGMIFVAGDNLEAGTNSFDKFDITGGGNFLIRGNANLQNVVLTDTATTDLNWEQLGNLTINQNFAYSGLADFVVSANGSAINGDFTARNDALFSNLNVLIEGTADVTGDLTAQLQGSGSANLLNVGGDAFLGGDWMIATNFTAGRNVEQRAIEQFASTTNVVGNATIGGSLAVATSTTFAVGGNLNINGMVAPDTPPDMSAASITTPAALLTMAVAAMPAEPQVIPYTDIGKNQNRDGSNSPETTEPTGSSATPVLKRPTHTASPIYVDAASASGNVDLINAAVQPLPAVIDSLDNSPAPLASTEVSEDAPAALQSLALSPNPLNTTAITTANTSATNDSTTRIDGTLIVGGNAQIAGEFVLGDDGIAQISGDGTFDLATIDGALIVGGVLTAEDLTVNGSARFGTAQLQSLTIGAGAILNGGNLQTTGDLTNLGTYQLGTADEGAGVLNIDGTFFQGGVFSGVGTINGDFVQQALSGGPTAADIMLNPGFSPGILNITGDATFNDGAIFMEIGGLAPGVGHDQINVSGNLTFGSNAMIVVDLLELSDGSGIFLPRTGDEIVLFTASSIRPGNVEQINFAVLDELPLGFTLVPDIMQNANGDIFRVLRGFDGSTLSDLAGLDPAQLAVAGAIDFLSTAESGVPSPELFELAVGLQFNADPAAQQSTLTALGGTTLSAMQGTAMRAGSYGLEFAKSRLRTTPNLSASQSGSGSNRPAALDRVSTANNGAAAQSGIGKAAAISGLLQSSGGKQYKTGNGGIFRVLGSTSYHAGHQDGRLGATGFDADGWSANIGVEYNSSNASILIGAAGSLGESDANLDTDLGTIEATSAGVSLYGQYRGDRLFVSAAYSFADLEIDSTRNAIGTGATGETDGNIHHFFGNIGVYIVNQDQWQFGPEVSLTHSKLSIDGYSETGAGALNLAVPSLDRTASALDVTANSAHQFTVGQWDANVQFAGGYQWALKGDQFTSTPLAFAAAPGTTFANPLMPLLNDGFDLSTAITLSSAADVRIGLGYTGFFGDNGQDQHDISFDISIPF